jgi:hypothetical protein
MFSFIIRWCKKAEIPVCYYCHMVGKFFSFPMAFYFVHIKVPWSNKLMRKKSHGKKETKNFFCHFQLCAPLKISSLLGIFSRWNKNKRFYCHFSFLVCEKTKAPAGEYNNIKMRAILLTKLLANQSTKCWWIWWRKWRSKKKFFEQNLCPFLLPVLTMLLFVVMRCVFMF